MWELIGAAQFDPNLAQAWAQSYSLLARTRLLAPRAEAGRHTGHFRRVRRRAVEVDVALRLPQRLSV